MLSCVQLFVTPWTVALQALLFIGFPRQGYWSGLPFSSPGISPTQGSNPGLLHCRQIFSDLSHQGSPRKKRSFAYTQAALKKIQIIKEHHHEQLKYFKVCKNHYNGQGLGGGKMKPHGAITLHIKIIRPKQFIKDRLQWSFKTKLSKKSREI